MNKDLKVAIAMSGGVDSSVAASIIKEKGYEISGIMLDLSGSSESDIEDAVKVSKSLDIPLEILDYKEDFKNIVIEDFVSTYEQGGTPNPCIVCNKYLKFGKLIDYIKEKGFSKIATGHYARVEFSKEKGRFLLYKATDETKDQSYVLYSLTQEQLGRVMFPLGELQKSEVRTIAESSELVNAHKKDSQDICFIKDNDYKAYIENFRNKKYPEGDFTDLLGNVLGTHKGIIGYTTGQRKGLGLSLKEPMYVVKKDIEKNSVILGLSEDLFSTSLIAKDVNFIPFDELKEEMKVTAKTRYKQKEADAVISPLPENKVKVTFSVPQRAITKGQSVVFYDNNLVIGGGIIE